MIPHPRERVAAPAEHAAHRDRHEHVTQDPPERPGGLAGERAEIIVEVEPGERTTLRSYPPDLGMGWLLGRTNGQRVERGATEIWQVHNDSNTYRNFHVHLVRFRILDLDGRAPPPELAGGKDTVFVPPAGRARIMRFDTVPDATAPFMYHCHILDHEDAGMMGQFVITEPFA